MALTDQVIMPGSDYQAICDATRALTGKTGVLKSGDIVTKLNNFPILLFNETLTLPTTKTTYAVSFKTLSGEECSAMTILDGRVLIFEGYGEVYIANQGWVVDASLRRITLLSTPTEEFLTWLNANVTKYTTPFLISEQNETIDSAISDTIFTPRPPYDALSRVNVHIDYQNPIVRLSMASGNQVIKTSDLGHKFMREVTIQKPSTLIPSNIKKGVDIGGVVGTLESGGSISPKDINFYDYDGTCVAAWSLAELAGKTALPDYPSHDGLTCQGWNWSLNDLKAQNTKMNVGAMYITSDGKTRIYITLQEGRKSPMLGICPNGTVTVDWGDGTTPDTLTGTSVNDIQWTPTHNYAASGDYVITLTVDGSFGLLGLGYLDLGSLLLSYSSDVTDTRSYAYKNAIHRVLLGSGVTDIGTYAFASCCNLAQITLPSSVTSIGTYAFEDCYSLAQITLPSGITSIGNGTFQQCCNLSQITLPSGVTSIGNYAFTYCYSLSQITLPSGVTSLGTYAFQECNSLSQITLPRSGVASIGERGFKNCYSLSQITLGVTDIGIYAFQSCHSLASITLLSGVTNIGAYAFQNCYSSAFYDFTACTAVPTLASTNAFASLPADCEIRVPAALLDEWKAATNWATYANQIVGV